MSQVFASLIDALKDAKTWLLLAAGSAGFAVWRISWGIDWISSIGLIVFVFCGVGLLWRFFDWGKKQVDKAKWERSREIHEVRGDASNLMFRIRGASGSRGFVQDITISGELASLYLRLQGLGVATPEVPPSAGRWVSRVHAEYLETIKPFLSVSQIEAARSAAVEYLKACR